MVVTLERFVEKSIPFQAYIDAFDFIVILFFALDLYYKRTHCNSWTYFVKNYWLEILATIPFFWIFRIPAQPSEALRVVGEAGEVGRVLHPVAEVEGGGRLFRIPSQLQFLKLPGSTKALRLLATPKVISRKKNKKKKKARA